jgi:phage terminase Nu1 subunit (DNA packaging protein)
MTIKDSLSKLKQADLMALFGVTDRTIQRWHDQALPRHGEGRGCYYVWTEVLPWYVTFMSGSKRGGSPEDVSETERLKSAQADLAELTRDERAGLLVLAAEVTQEWADILTMLRSNLMGYGDRLIPLLAETTNPREQLAIARREMNQTLRAIVEKDDEL